MPLSLWQQLLHGHLASYAQTKTLIGNLGYEVDTVPGGFTFNLAGHAEPFFVQESKTGQVENPGSTIAFARAIARDEPKGLPALAGTAPSSTDAFEGFKKTLSAYGTFKINKAQHQLTIQARSLESNAMKPYAVFDLPSLADMDKLLDDLGRECLTTARYQQQLQERLQAASAQEEPKSRFPVEADEYRAKLANAEFSQHPAHPLPDYAAFQEKQRELSKTYSPTAFARCLAHILLHHGLKPSIVAQASNGVVQTAQIQSWVEGKTLPNPVQFNATEYALMSILAVRGEDILVERLPEQLLESWDETNEARNKPHRPPDQHPILSLLNRILLAEQPKGFIWSPKQVFIALSNQGNRHALANQSAPLQEEQVTHLLAGKDPHLTPYWQYQLYKFLNLTAMPNLRGHDDLIEENYLKDDFHKLYLKEFPTHRPTAKHPIPTAHDEPERDYADSLSLQLHCKYFSTPGTEQPLAIKAIQEQLENILTPYYGREVKLRVGKCCQSLFGKAANVRIEADLKLDAQYIAPALPPAMREAFLADVDKLIVARDQYFSVQANHRTL